jgi:fatty acid desaturase
MPAAPYRDLARVAPVWTAAKAAVIAAAVFAAAALGASSLPLLVKLLLAASLSSWAQQALLEEVHDGAHWLLLPDRGASDRLSGLYASLLGISFSAFRRNHLAHHQHFGRPADPDYFIYSHCPRGLGSWARFFARYFLGIDAVRQIVAGRARAANPGDRGLQHPLGTIAAQGGLLVAFGFAGGPLWYFAAWLLPLLTWTFGIVRLRTLLEHWDGRRGLPPGAPCGELWNLSGALGANLLAAQFGYSHHASHHLRPAIPNLSLARLDLASIPASAEVRHASYWARLRQAFALE